MAIGPEETKRPGTCASLHHRGGSARSAASAQHVGEGADDNNRSSGGADHCGGNDGTAVLVGDGDDVGARAEHCGGLGVLPVAPLVGVAGRAASSIHHSGAGVGARCSDRAGGHSRQHHSGLGHGGRGGGRAAVGIGDGDGVGACGEAVGVFHVGCGVVPVVVVVGGAASDGDENGSGGGVAASHVLHQIEHDADGGGCRRDGHKVSRGAAVAVSDGDGVLPCAERGDGHGVDIRGLRAVVAPVVGDGQRARTDGDCCGGVVHSKASQGGGRRVNGRAGQHHELHLCQIETAVGILHPRPDEGGGGGVGIGERVGIVLGLSLSGMVSHVEATYAARHLGVQGGKRKRRYRAVEHIRAALLITRRGRGARPHIEGDECGIGAARSGGEHAGVHGARGREQRTGEGIRAALGFGQCVVVGDGVARHVVHRRVGVGEREGTDAAPGGVVFTHVEGGSSGGWQGVYPQIECRCVVAACDGVAHTGVHVGVVGSGVGAGEC